MSVKAMIPNFTSPYMSFIFFVFSMLLRCFVNILHILLGIFSNMLSKYLFFHSFILHVERDMFIALCSRSSKKNSQSVADSGFLMANLSSCL